MTATEPLSLITPEFWSRPLQERMADFAALREQGPFLRYDLVSQLTGEDERFYAVTGMREVLELSRRPKEFCSGRGSVSIFDMPEEAREFFGSFIEMDDPRHARQRGIVSRTFTPKQLQGVLDSVETIADEVIDAMCEKGEVDLVEAISQPFPLLIICDMMGIPRSEFDTVLQATNVILGSGDRELLGFAPDEEPTIDAIIGKLFEAGMALTTLLNEVAEARRTDPQDDLTSKLIHANEDDDMLAPHELAAFFILLAVAGNDTTRTAISHGVALLADNPEQRAIWQADVEGVTPTAVEEIVRVASPVTFMRRTATLDVEVSGHQVSEGDKLIMFYGAANRDPRVFDDPETFDVLRSPNPHVGFGGPGPHFCLGAHLARREVAVMFRKLFERLPDLTTTAAPTPLEAMGPPLVGGIKRLPVSFTPTAPLAR